MRLVAGIMAAAVLAVGGLAMAQTDPTPPAPTEQTPSAQEPTTSGEAAQESSEAEGGQKMICRTVRSTESRLRRARQRVCGTRDEWEHMQGEIQKNVQHQGNVQPRDGQP